MKNKILLFFCLILCSSLVHAQEIHSNTVRIYISNIPDNTHKIFVPLTIHNTKDETQDNTISLDVKEFLDSILKGYVYHIQKDSNNRITGINITSTSSKTLPPSLSLDLELINNKNTNKEKDLTLKSSSTAFEAAPTYIQNSFAGITNIQLEANACPNLKQKRKINYIKILDNNISLSEKNKYNRERSCKKKNRLRKITIQTVLPENSQYNKIYLPLNINSNSLTTSIISINKNTVIHYEDNLLELSNIKSGFVDNNIKFTIEFNDDQVSMTDIKLGQLISQPNKQIDNLKVNILPSHIILNKNFKIKSLFELN